MKMILRWFPYGDDSVTLQQLSLIHIFRRGKARHNGVRRLNKVEDVRHGAVGHGRRDIARDGVRQGGDDVRLRKLLLPGAFAV